MKYIWLAFLIPTLPIWVVLFFLAELIPVIRIPADTHKLFIMKVLWHIRGEERG